MDGELRKIFSKNLAMAQWTPIETGATAHGVPDAEYCFPGGRQGFVEFKRTSGWAVTMRPEQIGWLLRRSRLGGRCWVAIRRLNRGEDQLWLVPGRMAAILSVEGLTGEGLTACAQMSGGPSGWSWSGVRQILCS